MHLDPESAIKGSTGSTGRRVNGQRHLRDAALDFNIMRPCYSSNALLREFPGARGIPWLFVVIAYGSFIN